MKRKRREAPPLCFLRKYRVTVVINVHATTEAKACAGVRRCFRLSEDNIELIKIAQVTK